MSPPQVDASLLPLSRTLRAVLIDERDAVLAHAIKGAEGRTVVAVVGKAHVPGIVSLWDKDTAALVPPALEEPPPPILTRLCAGAAAAAAPFVLWRSRTARLALGGSAAGLVAGGAWLALALSDRMRFFEAHQSATQALAASPERHP